MIFGAGEDKPPRGSRPKQRERSAWFSIALKRVEEIGNELDAMEGKVDKQWGRFEELVGELEKIEKEFVR